MRVTTEHAGHTPAVSQGRQAGDAAGTHREHKAIARRTALLAPPVLILSMYAVFEISNLALGPQSGYLAAFATYWIVWGVAFPLWAVGYDGIVDLFRLGRSRWGIPSPIAIPLLAGLPLLGFLFIFPTTFPGVDETFVVIIAAYALVNGALEEVFWRGLFARLFPHDVVRGLIYPAVTFALWHLTLIALSPVWPPGGPLAALALALGLGFLYGWVAWRTGSIRWTAISHVLTNFSGIGALILFAPS